ncbi:hypothetical protein Tco_1465986 [Tanacetum coccineum]
MVSYPPDSASVCFAGVLPLDLLLLLILTISGSVFKLPFVLSLAFSKSSDLFIHTFLELHYWTLTLEVSQTSTLITVALCSPDFLSSSRILQIWVMWSTILQFPNLQYICPLWFTFPLSIVVSITLLPCILLFGGGDDEGSVAANSVMHASADGNRGLEGTGSSIGTVEGSAELGAPPPPRLLITSQLLHSCHHHDGLVSEIVSSVGRMVSRILLRVLLILFRIEVNNVAW